LINVFLVENMRVDVTPDEKFIYVGKNELKVLEREGGAYKLLDNATHIKPFIDLKLLNSGEVITFDENTSDLIKYDPSLNEINRLQGAKKIDLGKKKNSINTRKVLGLYIKDALIYFVFLRNDNPMVRKLQSDCLGDSKLQIN